MCCQWYAHSYSEHHRHRHLKEADGTNRVAYICMLGSPYSTFGYWTDRQTSLLQRSPPWPSPLGVCTRRVELSAIWI